jgi:hypothetical protein
MKAVNFCPLCQRPVQAVKKPSWPLMIVLFPFYEIYYVLFKKKDRCPVCSAKIL